MRTSGDAAAILPRIDAGTRRLQRAAAPTPVRPPRLLFVGLMVGLLLSELDHSIFATALPTVVGELDGLDQMLWVTTAYVLAATVMMPVYGKLGDLIGRKRIFIAALSVFMVGSVIGGVSPDMTWLIIARAVQGLGAGGLLVLIQAIVADLVPARVRAPYLSVIGATFALSAVLGPPLGGWLAQGVGWRWAFWINLPLGAAAIASAAAFLPRSPARSGRVRVDVGGIMSLTVAVTSLVLLASWAGTAYAWGSTLIVSIGVTAVAAGVVFVYIERRAAEPLISLSLFRDRNFSLAVAAGLIMAVAMFGTIGYLPTYLQLVRGLSPSGSGLWMLSLVGGLGTMTLASAQIVTRTGRYRWLLLVGSGVVATALLLLSTLTVRTDLAVVGVCLFLLGAGMGCVLEILVLLVQNSVGAAQVGTATAANSFFREIGVAVGSALVGTVFTSRLTGLLAERLPGGPSAGVDVSGLTPARLQVLPEATQAAVVSSYHDALSPVFGLLVPLMLVSLVILSRIREIPLATTLAPAELTAVRSARAR